MIYAPLTLLAAAGALAATPAGFTPTSQNDLVVAFNGRVAASGSVQIRDQVQTTPQVGTTTRLTGSSYAVFMIDLDIPRERLPSPTISNTLIHWLQTGLTPATTATRFNGSTTTGEIFLLTNSSQTAPVQAYFGPAPPALNPLSHRYTQVLVDTSSSNASAVTAFTAAVRDNRIGFDLATVLQAAGLTGRVVAGNFFNVTNPGPVNSTGTGTGGGAGTGTGNGTANPTSPVPTAGAMIHTPLGAMVAGLCGFAALFTML